MNIPFFFRRGFGLCGFAVAIMIFLAANAQAVVTLRTVTQNGDSGPGSLRQAILDSAPNDVINFSVTGTIMISSVILQINKSLVITGPGARNLNIATTGNAFEVFRILSGNVTISDLTIGPGQTGITLFAGTLTVNNCAVSGNIQGGGLFTFAGSTLTMNNCTLSGNQKDVQAGAALESDGTSTLTNCTIAGNISKKNVSAMIPSGLGGGVSNNGGVLTLINCTVTGNSAATAGGGIYNLGGGTFQLTDTIVSANTAPSGPDGSGAFTSNGYNLIAKKDGITAGFTNNVNHDIVGTIAAPRDALLLGLQNNGGPTDTTAIFASSSPAVNAGAPFQSTARDQRAFIRPDAADIGACEFQGIQPVTLANISSRAVVQTGNDILIGGFIVTGAQLKKVLLRAIGPSLTLGGKLSDPVLELYSGNQLVTRNDDWQTAPNKQAIIDTGAAPTQMRESAILTSLIPGSYTVQVSGFSGATGIGVVEAYDLDRTVGSRLANISTRAAVQTDDNILIGGFIVLGPDSLPVIVRGIGPSLSVPNPLLDPTLELHDGNGMILASNDNWRTTQEAAIIATTIPPTNNAESAIVMTLVPGNYTTILRGVNNTTGVAVVEVYGLL